jgi:hypothetical protein
MNTRFAFVALACFAAVPAMACYTVYDRTNTLVYNAQVPPVDMTQPLREAVDARWPGGHMVFGDDAGCPRLNETRRQLQRPSTTGRSPLLTDAATARAMGLPHTTLGNGVVVVPDRPDSMRPGVVVTDAGLQESATTAMGAGPAPVAPAGPPPGGLAESGLVPAPVVGAGPNRPRVYPGDARPPQAVQLPAQGGRR